MIRKLNRRRKPVCEDNNLLQLPPLFDFTRQPTKRASLLTRLRDLNLTEKQQ